MRKDIIIFFDFDGVIADSFKIAFDINKLSRPSLTIERYRAAFNENINEAQLEDKVVRKIDFVREYSKGFTSLDITPEIKNFIQKLAQEFQLFIISSTVGDTIHEYLSRHDILNCFTDILGNEIETSKIRKFQMLSQKYSIDLTNVIFLTDTTGDINEAKKAGIKQIVGILGGYQNEATLKKARPTRIVKNFSQFYDYVHL